MKSYTGETVTARDLPVAAYSLRTGEKREFRSMKSAGLDLFGDPDVLKYPKKQHGDIFYMGEWVIDIGENVYSV